LKNNKGFYYFFSNYISRGGDKLGLSKKVKVIITFVFVLAFMAVGVMFYNRESENLYVEVEAEEVDVVEKKESEDLLSGIKVDIKGAVVKPGVYEANGSDRIVNIIEKAGGLSKGADTSNLNLSKIVQDEMVIVVSTKDDLKKEALINSNKVSNQVVTSNKKIINDAAIDSTIMSSITKMELETGGSVESSVVNINTASLDELMTLNGIGESKANSIIDYRNTNGLFTSIEDIKNVSGIGDSAYSKIKDYITV